jgi:hypothetical protein
MIKTEENIEELIHFQLRKFPERLKIIKKKIF